MSNPVSDLELIEHQVAQLASALNPPDVFQQLLDGSRLGAPRATILLLRQGRLKGWGSVGYSPETARIMRAMTLAMDSGWLHRIVGDPAARLVFRSPGEAAEPLIGQGPSSEAVGAPIRIGGKTVGALLAERNAGESPWRPPVLGLLVTVARTRLELDLAWRKLRTASSERSGTGTEAAKEEETLTLTPPVAESARESGLAPRAKDPTTDVEERRRDEARRYARLVATDIRLYNEEAVVLGRRHRDLARRIADHLAMGKETFGRRFPDLGSEGLTLLREAYIQVLAGGDSGLLPPL